MKTTHRFLTAMSAMLLLITTFSYSQEEKPPMYITVTTMYWNPDSDMTPEEWLAGEKEYMDKVTKKNEHILWSGYATHLMSPNSNEVIYAQTYPTWADIELAAARTTELEKEAWADEDARKTFVDKLGSAYSIKHSDEIYATLPGIKAVEGDLPDGAIVYIRKNKAAFPEDGSGKEYNDLTNKMLEDVIKKNDYIRGYYPSQHAWGSDRRDFMQVFYLNSMEDLDKMFTKNQELMKSAFSDDESKAMGKYFSSHGDSVYSVVKL